MRDSWGVLDMDYRPSVLACESFQFLGLMKIAKQQFQGRFDVLHHLVPRA